MNKEYKEYKEVELNVYNLEECVNCLVDYKNAGELVSVKFNGIELFSDTVTMDGAYKLVTGITKKEHDELIKNKAEEYKKECEEHKKQIPTKVDKWRAEGRKVLDEKHWEFWDKIVPVRLDDLYRGMELGASLDIIKVLNETGDLDKAKEIIESQGHSGMSFWLVRSIVEAFSDKGDEFVAYVRS